MFSCIFYYDAQYKLSHTAVNQVVTSGDKKQHAMLSNSSTHQACWIICEYVNG